MPHIDVKLETIPFDRPLRFERDGMAIVIVRSGERVNAYPDTCPHANWRLSDGEVRNGVLECPGHGWEFNVATGACLTVADCRLKPLNLHVAAGNVRVELDQPCILCTRTS